MVEVAVAGKLGKGFLDQGVSVFLQARQTGEEIKLGNAFKQRLDQWLYWKQSILSPSHSVGPRLEVMSRGEVGIGQLTCFIH